MIAWVLPLLLAPASAPPATAPAADAAPTTDADDAALAQARADVTTVLTDQSKAYLQARARLVAQGERGKAALFERLDGVPPPSSAERKRIFDVLAEIGGTDVATRAGQELRRAVLAETREVAAAAAAEPWRPVLRDLGEHARAALGALVADRALPLGVRALLLDDLVALTPDPALGELLVLAGRGHATLRQQFSRSLRRRVIGSATATREVLAQIDASIDAAVAPTAGAAPEPERLAALVALRSAVVDAPDEAFVARLAAWAEASERPFAVRVAAVRALAAAAGSQPAAVDALERVATASLPGTRQADEILAWLSLSSLPRERAASLADRHDLSRSSAPRLAAVGFATMTLPPGEPWLTRGLDDVWPQVRQAALARVEGPCDRKRVAVLRGRVGAAKAGADPEPVVQRAAIVALGRCGGDAAFAALRELLDDGDVAHELSGEAARQLVRHFDARGADAVARMLASRPEADYARRLAQALRYADQPTERARTVLCAWTDEGGEVGRAAADTLAALFDDADAACGEPDGS